MSDLYTIELASKEMHFLLVLDAEGEQPIWRAAAKCDYRTLTRLQLAATDGETISITERGKRFIAITWYSVRTSWTYRFPRRARPAPSRKPAKEYQVMFINTARQLPLILGIGLVAGLIGNWTGYHYTAAIAAGGLTGLMMN